MGAARLVRLEMGMTNIVVTQAAVRNLATAFSNIDSSKLRHNDRLALIADAFGWKVDAFMHSLKENQKNTGGNASIGKDLPQLNPQIWGEPRDLAQLGLRQSAAWKRIVDQGSGVVIVTGATGSGRTTTLVATAKFLAEKGRRVVESDFQDGDVVLFGAIRDVETAKAAYDLADRGHLVLATMARMPDDNLRDLLRWGVPAKQLGLTRAILLQFLIMKLARHPGLEVPGEDRYKGRAVVSCLDSFDDDNTVSAYMKQQMPWQIEIIADLSGKLANGVIDMAAVERTFGEKYCEYLEGLLPTKRMR